MIDYEQWALLERFAGVEPVLLPEVLVAALALGLWRFLRRRDRSAIRRPF